MVPAYPSLKKRMSERFDGLLFGNVKEYPSNNGSINQWKSTLLHLLVKASRFIGIRLSA
jgi:hypothetical protein